MNPTEAPPTMEEVDGAMRAYEDIVLDHANGNCKAGCDHHKLIRSGLRALFARAIERGDRMRALLDEAIQLEASAMDIARGAQNWRQAEINDHRRLALLALFDEFAAIARAIERPTLTVTTVQGAPREFPLDRIERPAREGWTTGELFSLLDQAREERDSLLAVAEKLHVAIQQAHEADAIAEWFTDTDRDGVDIQFLLGMLPTVVSASEALSHKSNLAEARHE